MPHDRFSRDVFFNIDNERADKNKTLRQNQ